MNDTQSLTDLITQTSLLLEKYDSSAFLLTKKAGDYSEQLKLQIENGVKLLKAEIVDLDIEATISKLREESEKIQADMAKTAENFDASALTKELEEKLDAIDADGILENIKTDASALTKELEEKLEKISSSLEEKLKTIDADGILETIKTDTDDAIAKIKASAYIVKMVDFQHTLPSKLKSDTKYDFSILGGNADATYKIDTQSVFACSKVKNIDAGDVVTITTPKVEDATTTYEIAIIEVLNGVETPKILDLEVGYINKSGQMLFDEAGTHTFIVPTGIETVCAVAVGGGGGGSYSWANTGGAGGGLAWVNDIAVTAGEQITVVVGKGGACGSSNSPAGGDSYFKSVSICKAQGGQTNRNGGTYTVTKAYGDSGGGAGGNASGNYCGGGAGGYSGNGGDSETNAQSNSGAGGGGKCYSSTYGSPAGGGVGLEGQGNDGVAGFFGPNGLTSTNSSGYGGQGGSGGEHGDFGENPSTSSGGVTNRGINGGKFGGGGGGGGSSIGGGSGGDGGVRVIWGENRSFPFNAKDVAEEN